MGKIKNIHYPKDEGQARGDKKQHGTPGQATQKLRQRKEISIFANLAKSQK